MGATATPSSAPADAASAAAASAAAEASRLAAARELLALFRERGCHPLRSLVALPLVAPALILSIFFSIDNLCLKEPAMATEGLLWFPSLLAADSTNLLPILSALTWLVNFESGVGARDYHDRLEVKSRVRTLAATTWMLAANLPAGVHLFWIVSNSFAIARGRVVGLDRVRAALGIPLAAEVAAAAAEQRAAEEEAKAAAAAAAAVAAAAALMRRRRA